MYNIILSPQSVKDAKRLEQAGLKPKAVKLLRVIRQNPFQSPPPYEKLQGYKDTYSRRITIQHRLVYQVLSNENNEKDISGIQYRGIVKIIRMWTHYE
jgi:Txe/YoeB family toxin of toxin-antitoxin system